jgi:hypothetical protein
MTLKPVIEETSEKITLNLVDSDINSEGFIDDFDNDGFSGIEPL